MLAHQPGTNAATDTPKPAAAPQVVTTTNPPVTTGGPFNGAGGATAVTAITSGRKGGQNEIVLYQNVAMLTGKQAGNPWLLELPDPITRATWDNYAMISVQKARELGIDFTSTDYEYFQDKPLIDLTVN